MNVLIRKRHSVRVDATSHLFAPFNVVRRLADMTSTISRRKHGTSTRAPSESCSRFDPRLVTTKMAPVEGSIFHTSAPREDIIEPSVAWHYHRTRPDCGAMGKEPANFISDPKVISRAWRFVHVLLVSRTLFSFSFFVASDWRYIRATVGDTSSHYESMPSDLQQRR